MKDVRTREKIENLLKEEENLKEAIERLAMRLYKNESGKEFVGGYKRALRELGFII